jgi:hypothetical protein
MSFYLTARYSRRDELRGYAEKLTKSGFEVGCRWLDTTWVDRPGESSNAPPERRGENISANLEDLCSATTVVSFTEPPATGKGRGGRHVEYGYALALNKTLVVVGPRENLFHHHPDVAHFDTPEAWLRDLVGIGRTTLIRLGFTSNTTGAKPYSEWKRGRVEVSLFPDGSFNVYLAVLSSRIPISPGPRTADDLAALCRMACGS